MLERLLTVIVGAALVVTGALVPATGPYLIPAGACVIGWAIPHPADINS